MANALDTALTRLARDHSGQVLALLARRFNDVDVADDAVQEAMIEAAQRWPGDGIPDNPAGWLHRVAQRKAIDRVRRLGAEQRRLDRVAGDLVAQSENADEERSNAAMLDDDDVLAAQDEPTDERLRLMFLCCHPALSTDAQVGLTLRLVGGLTTEEIAAGFLVPTPTLAARITRAKKKIRAANIPLAMPTEIDERLDALLTVLYLIFNEGYLSRAGGRDPLRVDLCEEAIRLATVVHGLAPESAEAKGLLALLLLTHARRDARFRGETLVLLDDQDRSIWHLEEIEAGTGVLTSAMKLRRPGPYQLQAAIAAQHGRARTAEDTNWPLIVSLYDQLAAMRPSPIVALNRAVAVAMADGPNAGLRALDRIKGLNDYHLYHSARAELLARQGFSDEARTAFERALELAANPSERSHIAERIAAL